MRFSMILATLAVIFSTNLALAGGPDIRSKNASIESVEVDDKKIVMIVSGHFELFYLADSKEDGVPTEKSVPVVLSHCVVTFIRGSDVEVKNMKIEWKEFCEKVKSFVGKSAWLDLQGSVTIDSQNVVSVRATSYRIGAAKAAND